MRVTKTVIKMQIDGCLRLRILRAMDGEQGDVWVRPVHGREHLHSIGRRIFRRTVSAIMARANKSLD